MTASQITVIVLTSTKEKAVNRERFEELAKLKGMDVTRANRRITFVNLDVIEVGEYISRMTEAAWWGWREAMKDKLND